MIQFFRKIRQDLLLKGKPAKYLKYAIGEIILVVIGILIALQINNWNEARKNDLKASILVKNIIEDLRIDSVHIHKSLYELANQLEVTDHLIAKVLDSSIILTKDSLGLIRYSSDFRPITQRNHANSVSNLENESIRERIQAYFLKEDQVKDIFMEYESIVHNKMRPYLSDVGMHDLKSLYNEGQNGVAIVILDPVVLEEQLKHIKFQQLLYERRLKTSSFKSFLVEVKADNQAIIKFLNTNH